MVSSSFIWVSYEKPSSSYCGKFEIHHSWEWKGSCYECRRIYGFVKWKARFAVAIFDTKHCDCKFYLLVWTGKKWQVFPWQVALFKSWHAKLFFSKKTCQGKTWHISPSTRANKTCQGNWSWWKLSRARWTHQLRALEFGMHTPSDFDHNAPWVTCLSKSVTGDAGYSIVTPSLCSRAVNELLGKYICSILPARRESDTFPARRGRQKFFPGRTRRFCLTK